MSTPEAARRIRADCPELAETPVVAISNGFDEGTFSGEAAPRSDASFRIVHTGYLHTELGYRQHRTASLRRLLGGSVPGVDILCRSPVFLIEAVERVRRERPDIAERLEVHFAGVLSPTDLSVVRKSPATRVHGFVSHEESTAMVEAADLLFLPMHNLPENARATVVPGKTYEYVASGRPILAAVPAGDARDLLGAAGTALLCSPNDVGGLAEAIVGAYERRESGEAQGSPPPELLRRYEYRSLARDLARVFDQVPGTEPSDGYAGLVATA
jgi:glycosyltransferase involved in cell wall biosynthesis